MDKVNRQEGSLRKRCLRLSRRGSLLFLMVMVTGVNLQAQEFPSSLPWLRDTVYISASAPDGGDGSMQSPYNHFEDLDFNSKTAYLFKRGESMDIQDVDIGADSIYVGAYGAGEKPHFQGHSNHHNLTFSGNRQYIQNLKVTGKDTGSCFRFRTFNTSHTGFLWADSIEASHGFVPIRASQYNKVIITNAVVHHARIDGMYHSYNDTIIIKGANVTNVNLWHYDISGGVSASGGDCIQMESNGYVKVEDSYLDHSVNPGKFALIANVSDTVTVINSTLIAPEDMSAVYLGSSERGWHIEKCTVVGSRLGLENKGTLKVKNTTIRDCSDAAISGSAEVYNCTFANIDGKYALEGWAGNWKVYNSIFYDVSIVYGAQEKDLEASNNNYYNPGSKQPVNQWGANAMNVDPRFVDYNQHNFDLKSTSPMIDAGVKLNKIKQDIHGLKRPNGDSHDIGAHEYYEPGTEVYYEEENSAPILSLTYDESVKSGFVGNLDASGSNDPDGDRIYYSWKAPQNMNLVHVKRGKASFLAPEVNETTTYDIGLTIDDGQISKEKTVGVTINPYKPGVDELTPEAIEASDYQTNHPPQNLHDDQLSTRWSSQGDGEWVIVTLENKAKIDFLKLAYFEGDKRNGYFDIQVSNDKDNWNELLTDKRTSGISEQREVFEIPSDVSQKAYEYVRFLGYGNSQNQWNSVLEFEIYGNPSESTSLRNNSREANIKVYPNPTRDYVFVEGDHHMALPVRISVFTPAGKRVLQKTMYSNPSPQIPLNFSGGLYYIRITFQDQSTVTRSIMVK